jgi:hypothetical protein
MNSDSIPFRRIGYFWFRRWLPSSRHQRSFPAKADRERPPPLYCRIRHLQDLPLTRFGTHKGREPIVLRYVQFLRFASVCHGYQDRFLSPGRKEKEATEVEWCLKTCWACYCFLISSLSSVSKWNGFPAWLVCRAA